MLDHFTNMLKYSCIHIYVYVYIYMYVYVYIPPLNVDSENDACDNYSFEIKHNIS